MAGLTEYATNYTGIGQQLQDVLTSSTFYWLITIAIVFFIVVALVSGFKRVATPGNLKWLLLHTVSLFLIGYFLLPFNLNKYFNVLIFAFFVTIFSTIYRYLMLNVKFDLKNSLLWLSINLFTLVVIQILYGVLGVTIIKLQLLFAAFCLTLVGASIHPAHKIYQRPHHSHSHRRHRRHRRRH